MMIEIKLTVSKTFMAHPQASSLTKGYTTQVPCSSLGDVDLEFHARCYRCLLLQTAPLANEIKYSVISLHFAKRGATFDDQFG